MHTSMQNWVHCNKCLVQPSKNNLSFWMSSCGHIFCKNCIDAEINGCNLSDANTTSVNFQQCFVCNKQVQLIQINRSMRKDLLEMFKPPTSFVGDSLKRAKTIIEFQSMHHQRLFKCLQERNQKSTLHLKKILKELDEREGRIKLLVREGDEYKSELENTKRTITELRKRISEREKELHRLNQVRQSASSQQRMSYKRMAIQNAMDSRYTTSGLSFLGGGERVQMSQFNNTYNATQQTNDFQLNMQHVGGSTPLNNLLPSDSRPDLNLQNLMNTSTEDASAVVRGNIGRGLQNTATLLGITRTTESTDREFF
uniref:RING-type domain-containing protein n=1 Tax=Meloidogyne enterolobii TaxID=390850 RepID=A0A6V7TZL7_MELEN|nr:unnamed protein product [Meloidogyne enterolobii]